MTFQKTSAALLALLFVTGIGASAWAENGKAEASTSAKVEAKNVMHETGEGIKSGAHKVDQGIRTGAHKLDQGVRKGAVKVQEGADKGVEKVKDAFKKDDKNEVKEAPDKESEHKVETHTTTEVEKK